MTAALARGLEVIENQYYQTPEYRATLDYKLAMLSRIDACIGDQPVDDGTEVNLELTFTPDKDGSLAPKEIHTDPGTLPSASRETIMQCIARALVASHLPVLDPNFADGTTLRTHFTFPIAKDALYAFLQSGDPTLIISPSIPPLPAESAPSGP